MVARAVPRAPFGARHGDLLRRRLVTGGFGDGTLPHESALAADHRTTRVHERGEALALGPGDQHVYLVLGCCVLQERRPPGTRIARFRGVGQFLGEAKLIEPEASVDTVCLTTTWAVFAWMKQTRDSDETAKDLDDALSYVKETFEALCERAQKPCTATELAPLRRLRHLIRASAAQLDVLHTELHAVVEHLDTYLATALPEPAVTARVPYAQHLSQVEGAIRQEHARIELERAVNRAQQRIRSLRRT